MGAFKKIGLRRLKNIIASDYALTVIDTIIPASVTSDRIASCLNLAFILDTGL
jgi:hypothetical protein